MDRIQSVFQGRGPELFKHLQDYSFRSFLGEGSFGAVYKAKNRATGRYVAIKVNKTDKLPGESRRDFERRVVQEAKDFEAEARFLTRVVKGAQNILQIQDFVDLRYDDRMCIITDLHHGCLDDLIRSNKATKLVLFGAWRHMLRAIAFIAREGYCHRDVHPGNIFYSEYDVDGKKQIAFYLGDFGLTARIGTSDRKAGAYGFRSPEMLNGGPSSSTSDVFSLWSSICYSAKIVKLDNRDHSGRNVDNMRRISSEMAKGWKDVVTDRPDRRPTASELLARADSWGSFYKPDKPRKAEPAPRGRRPSDASHRNDPPMPARRRHSVSIDNPVPQGMAWQAPAQPAARRIPQMNYDHSDFAGPAPPMQGRDLYSYGNEHGRDPYSYGARPDQGMDPYSYGDSQLGYGMSGLGLADNAQQPFPQQNFPQNPYMQPTYPESVYPPGFLAGPQGAGVPGYQGFPQGPGPQGSFYDGMQPSGTQPFMGASQAAYPDRTGYTQNGSTTQGRRRRSTQGGGQPRYRF